MDKVILIANDSPDEALLLRRHLTQAGFKILMARNGMEAIEILKKEKVDMVIADVEMPKIDGYELCRMLKNNEDLCRIPLILCTNLSEPVNLIRGIEVGASNYITKPWDEKNLVSLVNEQLKNMTYRKPSEHVEEIIYNEQKYKVRTSQQDIVNFLLLTCDNIYKQNRELLDLRKQLEQTCRELKTTQQEQEKILLNIFPGKVAQELMAYGSVEALRYDEATVMFIDFVGFSKSSLQVDPQILLTVLGFYFENFDEIIAKHNLERIKTIGDGYMCVGGIPNVNATHAVDCVMAALEIQSFMFASEEKMNNLYNLSWKARIGIHTGPLVAGIVGTKRLAYDIWGETVNLASRLELYSEENEINISGSTYEKIKDYFLCMPRGKINIQNKSGHEEIAMDMYFVIGSKPINELI